MQKQIQSAMNIATITLTYDEQPDFLLISVLLVRNCPHQVVHHRKTIKHSTHSIFRRLHSPTLIQ